jgi:hypothetical protein
VGSRSDLQWVRLFRAIRRQPNDRSDRDVTQPVGYDANGDPLYAPRGITVSGNTFGEALNNLRRR